MKENTLSNSNNDKSEKFVRSSMKLKASSQKSRSQLNSPEKSNINLNTPLIPPKFQANPESIQKNKDLLKQNLSVKNRKEKPKGDGTRLVPQQMSDDKTRKLEGLQDDDTPSLRGVVLPSINTSLQSLGIQKKRNHVVTHKAHNIISRKEEVDVKRKQQFISKVRGYSVDKESNIHYQANFTDYRVFDFHNYIAMRDHKHQFDLASQEKMKADKRHLYLPDIHTKHDYAAHEEEKASVLVEETFKQEEDEGADDSDDETTLPGMDQEATDLNQLADAMIRLGGREDVQQPGDEHLSSLMDIRLFILLHQKHQKYFQEKLQDKFMYFKSKNPLNYYEYNLCRFREAEGNYITAGIKGIGIYHKDMLISKMDVKTFEYYMKKYQAVLQFKFFRLFKFFKVARFWKRSVIKGNRLRAIQRLNDTFFYSDDILGKTLEKHKKICLVIKQMKLIDQFNTTPWDIDMMTQVQQDNRKYIAKQSKMLGTQILKNFEEGIGEYTVWLQSKAKEGDLEARNPKVHKSETIKRNIEYQYENVNSNYTFSKLGMPSVLTQGRKAELQNYFLKFFRFAILCDQQTQTTLISVQIDTMTEFYELMSEKNNQVNKKEDLRYEFNSLQKFDGISHSQMRSQKGPIFRTKMIGRSDQEITDGQDDYQTPLKAQNHSMDILEWSWELLNQEENDIFKDLGFGTNLLSLILKDIVDKRFKKKTSETRRKNYRHIVHKATQVQPTNNELKLKISEQLTLAWSDLLHFKKIARSSFIGKQVNLLDTDTEQLISNYKTTDEPLNPSKNLINNWYFKVYKNRINNLVDLNFAKIEDQRISLDFYFNKFQCCKDELQFIEDLLVRRLEELTPSFECIIKQQRRLMELFREEINDQVQFGQIMLDSQSINEILQPMPKKCLNRTQEIIPKIQTNIFDEQWEQIDSRFNLIKFQPKNIDQFIEKENEIWRIYNKIPLIQDEIEKMMDLNKLMTKLEIENPSPSKLQKLEKRWKELDTLCDRLESKRSNRLVEFRSRLDELIPILNEEIETYFSLVKNDKYLSLEIDSNEALVDLNHFLENSKKVIEKTKKYENYSVNLEQNKDLNFESAYELKNLIESLIKLHTSLISLRKYQDEWLNQDWASIKSDEMIKENAKLLNVAKTQKSLQTNVSLIEDFFNTTTMQDQQFPIIKALKNPNFKPNQLDKIKELLGIDRKIELAQYFDRVAKILEMDLKKTSATIFEIAAEANLIYDTESSFYSIVKQIKSKQFNFKTISNGNLFCENLQIIKNEIEDLILSIYNVKVSRFSWYIEKEVIYTYENTQILLNTLEEFVQAQTLQVQFEPVFNTGDIAKDLQNEYDQFKDIKEKYTNIVKKCSRAANITRGLFEDEVDAENMNKATQGDMKNINENLDQILFKLDEFVLNKRYNFPRLFFLSNNELLKIFARSKQQNEIMHLLIKCFMNISRINIDDQDKLLGLVSNEGEEFNFETHYSILRDDTVEKQLKETERQMRKSMYIIIQDNMKQHNPEEKETWVLQTVNQVVLIISTIQWAESIEEVLTESNKRDGYLLVIEESLDLIRLMVENTKKQRDRIKTNKLINTITNEIKNRELTKQLLQNRVYEMQDFLWQAIPRAVQNAEADFNLIDNVQIHWLNYEFKYGYEYFGIPSKIIFQIPHTNYFNTICSNQLSYQGTMMIGPHSSGKAQIIKEFAGNIGQFVQEIDCKSFQSRPNLKHLINAGIMFGSWIIFKNLEQLSNDMLSYLAFCIQEISDAKKANKLTLWHEGNEITISKKSSQFATSSNPIGVLSTGSFKKVFRALHQDEPQIQQIIETKLQVHGFDRAIEISRKIGQLISFCKEGLNENAYTFNLQKVKQQIKMLVDYKWQNNKRIDEITKSIKVFIRVFGKMFSKADFDVVTAKIKSQFNLDTFDRKKQLLDSTVEENIQQVLKNEHITYNQQLASKIADTYEGLVNLSLNSCIVLGETETFKSTIINLFTELMKISQEGLEVKLMHINPRIVETRYLFGFQDETSRKQVEGVMSKIVKAQYEEAAEMGPNESLQYVITLDSLIDPTWTEVVESVIGNNFKLFLGENEVLEVSENIKFIFETRSLAHCTPKTLSNNQLVNIEKNQFKDNSKENNSTNNNRYQQELFKNNFEKTWNLTSEFVKELDKMLLLHQEGMSKILKSSGLKIIQQMPEFNWQQMSFNLVLSLFKYQNMKTDVYTERTMNTLIFFALIQLFIVQYDPSELRQNVHLVKEIRDYLEKYISLPYNYRHFMDLFLKVEVQKETQFTLTIVNWNSLIPQFQQDKELDFDSIIVPTIHTEKFNFFFDKYIGLALPVQVSGRQAIGKTAIITNRFDYYTRAKKEGEAMGVFPVNILISGFTSHTDILNKFVYKLKHTSKLEYSAPDGRAIIYKIDDLFMSPADEQGEIPVQELIRQLIDQKGLLDQKKGFSKVLIKNFNMICIDTRTPGSTPKHSNRRLLRHFNHMKMIEQDWETIHQIYKQILYSYLRYHGFAEDVLSGVSELCENVMDLFKEINQANVEPEERKPEPTDPLQVFDMRVLKSSLMMIFTLKSFNLSNADQLRKLIAHEFQRVYSDRLREPVDKSAFFEYLDRFMQVNDRFEVDKEKLKEKELKEKEQRKEGIEGEDEPEAEIKHVKMLDFSTIFTDLVKIDSSKIQEEVIKKERISAILKAKLNDYNISRRSEPIEIYMFDEIIDYAVRIARVLRTNGKHCILIGNFNYGKTTLIKLCSQIQDKTLYLYDSCSTQAAFKDQTISQIYEAGILEDKAGIVIHLNEMQIAEESQLENLVTIVQRVDLQDFFDKEKQNMINQQMEKQKDHFKDDFSDPNFKFQIFQEKVQQNLNIIFNFHDNPAKLATRFALYPAFIRNCYINFFLPLPKSSIIEMSEIKMSACSLDQNVLIGILPLFSEFQDWYSSIQPDNHQGILLQQQTYFEKIQNQRSAKLQDVKERLSKSIERTRVIDSKLTDLLEKNDKMGPNLLQLDKEHSQFLNEIDKTQNLVKNLEHELHENRSSVKIQNDMIKMTDAELKSYMDPSNEPINEALNQMNKQQQMNQMLGSLRTPTPPHEQLRKIIFSVLHLLDETFNKFEWLPAQNKLSDNNFISNILKKKLEVISHEAVKKVRTWIGTEDEKIVGQKSEICAIFLKWCKAVCLYKDCEKKAAPSKRKLNELKNKLETLTNKEEEYMIKIDKSNKVLEEFKKKLDRNLQATATQKAEQERSGSLIANARVVKEIKEEQHVRWNAMIEANNHTLTTLIGDSLIVSTLLAFDGDLSPEQSAGLRAKIRYLLENNGIKQSENLNLQDFLYGMNFKDKAVLSKLPDDDAILNKVAMANQNQLTTLIQESDNITQKQFKQKQHDCMLDINQDELINLEQDKELDGKLRKLYKSGGLLFIRNIPNRISHSLLNLIKQPMFKSKTINIFKKTIEVNADVKIIFYTSKPIYNLSKTLKKQIKIVNIQLDAKSEQDLFGFEMFKLLHPKTAQYFRDAVAQRVSCNYNQEFMESSLLAHIEYQPKLDMLFEDDKKMNEIQTVFEELSKNKGKLKEIKSFTEKINGLIDDFQPRLRDLGFLFSSVKAMNHMDPFYSHSTRIMIKYMKIIAKRYFDPEALKIYTDMRKRATNISKTMKDEGSYQSKTSTKIRDTQAGTLSPEMIAEIELFRKFFLDNYIDLISSCYNYKAKVIFLFLLTCFNMIYEKKLSSDQLEFYLNEFKIDGQDQLETRRKLCDLNQQPEDPKTQNFTFITVEAVESYCLMFAALNKEKAALIKNKQATVEGVGILNKMLDQEEFKLEGNMTDFDLICFCKQFRPDMVESFMLRYISTNLNLLKYTKVLKTDFDIKEIIEFSYNTPIVIQQEDKIDLCNLLERAYGSKLRIYDLIECKQDKIKDIQQSLKENRIILLLDNAQNNQEVIQAVFKTFKDAKNICKNYNQLEYRFIFATQYGSNIPQQAMNSFRKIYLDKKHSPAFYQHNLVDYPELAEESRHYNDVYKRISLLHTFFSYFESLSGLQRQQTFHDIHTTLVFLLRKTFRQRTDENLIINGSMFRILGRLLYSNDFVEPYDRDIINMFQDKLFTKDENGLYLVDLPSTTDENMSIDKYNFIESRLQEQFTSMTSWKGVKSNLHMLYAQDQEKTIRLLRKDVLSALVYSFGQKRSERMEQVQEAIHQPLLRNGIEQFKDMKIEVHEMISEVNNQIANTMLKAFEHKKGQNTQHKDRNLYLFFLKEYTFFRTAVDWLHGFFKELELIFSEGKAATPHEAEWLREFELDILPTEIKTKFKSFKCAFSGLKKTLVSHFEQLSHFFDQPFYMIDFSRVLNSRLLANHILDNGSTLYTKKNGNFVKQIMYLEITDQRKVNDLPGQVMSASEQADYKKMKEREAELAKRKRHHHHKEEAKVSTAKTWTAEDYEEVVYIHNQRIYNGELFALECDWSETNNAYLKTSMSKQLLQAADKQGVTAVDLPQMRVRQIPEVEQKHKTVHEKEFLSQKGIDYFNQTILMQKQPNHLPYEGMRELYQDPVVDKDDENQILNTDIYCVGKSNSCQMRGVQIFFDTQLDT